MQENDKPVLVYSTFPAAELAAAAGRELVEARLAACVNIIPGMISIYRWEGRIASDPEVVMIIKTRRSLADAAITAVRSRHPYQTPAILVLPVEGGSAPFLDWILAETAKSSS